MLCNTVPKGKGEQVRFLLVSLLSSAMADPMVSVSALFHPAWNLILSICDSYVGWQHFLTWLSFLPPGHAGAAFPALRSLQLI